MDFRDYYIFKHKYNKTYDDCNGNCESEEEYTCCRCMKYRDLQVLKVPYDKVLDRYKAFIKKDKWTLHEEYCLERLFVAHKMYHPSQYSLTSEPGYYGEELSCVKAHDYDFLKNVEKMLSISDDDEKIRFALKQEYDTLLDVLLDVHFEITSVKHDEILDHMVKSRGIGPCQLYSPIMGVYKKVGDKYMIIDGHHRYREAKASGFSSVDVFVFEQE